jgi:hypothetical protein
VEIKKRKTINGTVSAQDFNQIFNDIVAKELKSRGYFDDKYWNSYRVSRGLTFDTTTEEDKRCKKKVHAMENKVDCMSGIMQHWLAFMSKKYPEEDFITETKSALHDLVSFYSTCLTSFLKLYLLSEYLTEGCCLFFCRTILVKVKLTVMRIVIWMMTCKASIGRTKLNTCTNTQMMMDTLFHMMCRYTSKNTY